MSTRKEPTEIMRILMEALLTENQNTDMISKSTGVSWETTWKYLKVITWIQDCPRVSTERVGRSQLWSRSRGRLPE